MNIIIYSLYSARFDSGCQSTPSITHPNWTLHQPPLTASKMRHRCGTACFLIFLLFCLLTFLAETVLQIYLVVEFYRAGLHVWFALAVGFLLAAWVASQLVSSLWLKTQPEGHAKALAVLSHIFGFAVLWRYGRLLISSLDTKQDLSEISKLRLFLSFVSSLPIVLLETYLILNYPPEVLPAKELLYAAMACSMASSCWSLATHRKRPKDYHFLDTLISWPGTVFRIIWRLCELTSRILVLALFAGLHSFWILLVLGLHWLTMFTWSLTEHIVFTSTGITLKAFKNALISSYIYVFCYVNMNQRKSRLRFILFYLIMLVENTILMVLWFLFDGRISLHVPMAIVIGSAHLLALISAVLYYNCFHVKSAQVVQRGAEVMYMQPCVDCDPSCCNKNGRISQSAFNTAWWIEVKENTDHNPNSYDMLLPSELNQQQTLAKDRRLNDVRYIQTQTRRGHGQPYPDDSSSPPYETLSKYEQALCCVDPAKAENAQFNEGYVWDNYDLEHCCPQQGQNTSGLGEHCQGRYHGPFRMSDSGISASTGQSVLPKVRSRSDTSLFYSSDTSDMTSGMTSGMTSSSYVSYRNRASYSDQWSTTTSSCGHTPYGSTRECPYLPMLMPLRRNNGNRFPMVTDNLGTSQIGPDANNIVLYENPSELFSQTLPANGMETPGRHPVYKSDPRCIDKRSIPCGVAARLKQVHLAARSSQCRRSVVTSTTDSYDGSFTDPDGAASVQLPGTQSDLDFSVCGGDPYNIKECEYVGPSQVES